MKILQVTCDLNRSSTGVLTTTANFASALTNEGHAVTTVSFDRHAYGTGERMSATLPILASGLVGLNRYVWSPHAALGRFDHLFNDCDRILIHSLYGHHFTWAARRAMARRIPAFVIPHGALRRYCLENNGLRKSLWLRLNRVFIEHHATFICSSDYELKQSTAFIKDFSSVVLGWPVEVLPTVQTVPTESKNRVLLMVGRVHPMKRPLETIRAFLRTRNSNWQLLIVGPTSPEISEAMLRSASGEEWGNAVRFIGPVSHEDLAQYYRMAEGIVLFSQGENFANVVAEAMCFGRRAFISDDVGVETAVRKGDCGRVYRISSEESIDDAFRDIFGSVGHLSLEEVVRIADFSQKEFSFASFSTMLSSILSRPRVETKLCEALEVDG